MKNKSKPHQVELVSMELRQTPEGEVVEPPQPSGDNFFTGNLGLCDDHEERILQEIDRRNLSGFLVQEPDSPIKPGDPYVESVRLLCLQVIYHGGPEFLARFEDFTGVVCPLCEVRENSGEEIAATWIEGVVEEQWKVLQRKGQTSEALQ